MDRLDTHRCALMLTRNAGLTATYNLMHNPGCRDVDIAELRTIQQAIDEEGARAYGWQDLLHQAGGLDHGFHHTRQGIRFTVGPAVRQEILDRKDTRASTATTCCQQVGLTNWSTG
jgi:hypothetical protein